MSFFEQITGPLFGLEHLFLDVMPLFAKFLVITLMLLLVIVPLLVALYCCGSWCYKKRFTPKKNLMLDLDIKIDFYKNLIVSFVLKVCHSSYYADTAFIRL